MRTFVFSCLAVLLLMVTAGDAFPQRMTTERASWGTDKVPDGSMHEWSGLGSTGGHGSVDNEWYFYDTGDDFWNDPQGGVLDEPLSILLIENNPGSGNPEAVASGFNLWGGYLCYEPYNDEYSVSVALDLPLSSNANVSADYVHTYNGLPPGGTTFYPVAFDCDGNGDPLTVNSNDYFPGSGNGFNFVIGGGLVYDDRDEENYKLTLYLGDDNFPVWPPTKTLAPGGTDGLIIVVNAKSEFGVIKAPIAYIPGSQTKSGLDLDLIATYGSGVLEVGGYNNPDPFSNPRIVDIEVKINMLKTILEDPTYIDWNKIPIGKFELHDLRKQYVSIKSGSLDDKSDEHLVQGGHVFPPLPFRAVVDKKVMCGDCAGSTTAPEDDVYALRQSDLRFEVDIAVPAEFTAGFPNGQGYIDLVEDCTYLNANGQPVTIPGAEWELCEVTLNGNPNVLSIPDFNLNGLAARIKDKGTGLDFLFNALDQVQVVYAVYPNNTPGTANLYTYDPDIANLVFVNAVDPAGVVTKSNEADAFVDILKPTASAIKAVEILDKNGVKLGPLPDLSESWWTANVPVGYYPAFPVEVTWYLASLNQSGNPLWLDYVPVTDPVLDGLQNVVWNPANRIPVPNPVGPADYGLVTAKKIYQTFADFQADTNVGNEIHNTFATDSTVVTDNAALPTICYLMDGQPVPDYFQHAEASAMLWMKAPPAEINVVKEVSCFQNGPWFTSEQSFVNTWVYYRITLNNTSASVPIDNAYLTDTLTGAYVGGSLEIVQGPTFTPGVTENLGPIVPAGSITIIFRVKTDPNFNTWGNTNDIVNSAFVEGDGPDAGSAPDNGPKSSDNSGPIPVDILLDQFSMVKEVMVEEVGGSGSWGPSATVSVPGTAIYPLKITWNVSYLNTSESPITPDLTGRDNLLELFPLLSTAPVGALPPWAINNMPINVPQNFSVAQKVNDYGEMLTLDGADGATNFAIDNRASFENAQYGNPDVCGTLNIPGQQDNAKVNFEPPPAEVAVIKHVSCFQNGPWNLSQMSFVDTWVYYRVWVRNPSQSVPIDNCYITDTLVGAFVPGTLEFIQGPSFTPGVIKNLGPLAPDDNQPGGADEITIIFRVKTDPAFNVLGETDDIENTVLIEADGPDAGTDPDNGPSSSGIAGPIPVDIVLSEFSMVKEVMVQEVGGPGTWGPASSVSVPGTAAYPLKVTWGVSYLNSSEVPITPNLTGRDTLIELFPLLSAAPVGPIPPWAINNMPIGLPQNFIVTQQVKDYGEMLTLDGADGATNFAIYNLASFENAQYANADVCGTLDIPGQQDDATINFEPPDAEVAVIKHVSCFQNGPWSLSEMSFVDTWVYYRVWVRNTSSTIPIDNCYLTDTLEGAYVPGSLEFIQGPSFTPGVIKNLGPLAPDNSQPGGPDEIQIIFRVKTEPNFNVIGNTDDIKNSVLIEADGPDAGTDPDNGANSTATAGPVPVDILLGEMTIEKEVLVEEVGGAGSWGPAASVTVPPTAAYPLRVTWTVTYLNSSEAPITPDVAGRDTLLELFPLISTPPVGALPPWAINNMPIGVPQIFNVEQEVKTFAEMVTVDTADGTFDYTIDNTASFETVQYTNADICGTLIIERKEDAAKVVYPAPPAEVEITKEVSCFENGPWSSSQMSFPGTWVFYRIWIHNKSQSIPIDHTYVTDTIAGAYKDIKLVSGPMIVPGVATDIGPLAPDAEVEIIFKVLTDPAFNVVGNTDDIVNSVLVEVDGPDDGTDPDSGPESSATAGPVPIDIIIGEITIDKVAEVTDADGIHYGPSDEIHLTEATKYPLDITWLVTYTNVSEVPVTPDVVGNDLLLEQLPLLANPPTGDPLPWIMNAMPIGVPQEFTVTQTVVNIDEAKILDQADGTFNKIITNTAYYEDVKFSHVDVCGELTIERKEAIVNIWYVDIPEEEIPTLSEWGMILMAAVLGALMLLRLKRIG